MDIEIKEIGLRLGEKLSVLTRAVKDGDCITALMHIKNAIKQTVSTFHKPDEVNNAADAAEEMKQIKHQSN